MGLDYAIDLYFPIEQLEQALLETVKIAVPEHDPLKNVSIKLLDGKEITVPFTTNFKPGRLELKTGSGAFELDTVLLFPLDDAISNFLSDFPPEFRDKNFVDIDGIKYGSVGYIYLYLHISRRYVCFHYLAATSGMSRLFVDSTSIHKRFLEVLRAAKGVAGLIYIESDEYPLLADPQQKIYFDEMEYLVDDGEEFYANGYYDIDRLMDTILPLLPQ